MLVGGVWLARDRRRALIAGATGIMILMIIFAIVAALLRSYYLSHLPPTVSRDAAIAAIDILTHFLRESFWALVVLAGLAAVTALIAGPSAFAVAVRNGSTKVMGGLGDRAEQAELLPSAVRQWVGRYRRLLERGLVGATAIALIAWRGRTVAGELWTVFAACILLLVVEMLSERPTHVMAGVAVPSNDALASGWEHSPDPADDGR
jgi:hypothetical protein